MRASPVRSVQNLLHDIQGAVDVKPIVSTLSYTQRLTFLRTLSQEIRSNHKRIMAANRYDCELFAQQQRHLQRGVMPSPGSLSTNGNSSMSLSPSSASLSSSNGSSSPSASPSSGSNAHKYPTSESAWAAVAQTAGNAPQGVGNSSPRSRPQRFPTLRMRNPPPMSLSGSCFRGSAAYYHPDERSGSQHGGEGGQSSLGRSAGMRDSLIDEAIPNLGMDREHSLGQEGARQEDEWREEPSGSMFSVSSTSRPSTHGTHHELSPLSLDKLLVGIDFLMNLPDPLSSAEMSSPRLTSANGEPMKGERRCKDFVVRDITVPLGMVAVLSRYRPRITLDAVAMCIQSGNCILIDGGASVHHSNAALFECVQRSLAVAGIPSAAVVYVKNYSSSHKSTIEWLRLSERIIDTAIVSGSNKLYTFASHHASTIPLIKAVGRSCSLYVDKSASLEKALRIILNSKFQRAAATNAINTLFIHEDFPYFELLLQELNAYGALLLGDYDSQQRFPSLIAGLASEDDYKGLSEGFFDFYRLMCIKSIRSLDQVVFFLELFGSKQTDGVIAEDESVISSFVRRVDSAVVTVNASTRLSSGVGLGLGADLAIATSKLHCRGPLTLTALTTTKRMVLSASEEGAYRE